MFGNDDSFDSFDQLFELNPPKPRLGPQNREHGKHDVWNSPDLMDDPDPVESWSLNDFSDLLD